MAAPAQEQQVPTGLHLQAKNLAPIRHQWAHQKELRIAPFSLPGGCCSTFCCFKAALTYEK